MKKNLSKKSQAHQRYRLADGTIVPGVTTITGLRAKPFLIKWANNLGLEGIDSDKYTDEKADIGTLAHYLILCHLKGEKPVLTEYSEYVTNLAENSFLKYLAWEKNHKIEPIYLEKQLVSEELKFGGCIDFYGKIDGQLCLRDFKTSNAIYPDTFYQLAGYSYLINGKIDSYGILRIGRTEDEGFEERNKSNIDKERVIFRNLLEIYCLEKAIKNDRL